jgi:hypothetical protein
MSWPTLPTTVILAIWARAVVEKVYVPGEHCGGRGSSTRARVALRPMVRGRLVSIVREGSRARVEGGKFRGEARRGVVMAENQPKMETLTLNNYIITGQWPIA